jgi:hypothetical protein
MGAESEPHCRTAISSNRCDPSRERAPGSFTGISSKTRQTPRLRHISSACCGGLAAVESQAELPEKLWTEAMELPLEKMPTIPTLCNARRRAIAWRSSCRPPEDGECRNPRRLRWAGLLPSTGITSPETADLFGSPLRFIFPGARAAFQADKNLFRATGKPTSGACHVNLS